MSKTSITPDPLNCTTPSGYLTGTIPSGSMAPLSANQTESMDGSISASATSSSPFVSMTSSASIASGSMVDITNSNSHSILMDPLTSSCSVTSALPGGNRNIGAGIEGTNITASSSQNIQSHQVFPIKFHGTSSNSHESPFVEHDFAHLACFAVFPNDDSLYVVRTTYLFCWQKNIIV